MKTEHTQLIAAVQDLFETYPQHDRFALRIIDDNEELFEITEITRDLPFADYIDAAGIEPFYTDVVATFPDGSMVAVSLTDETDGMITLTPDDLSQWLNASVGESGDTLTIVTDEFEVDE